MNRRISILCVAVLVAGFGGCSSGGEDDCRDIVKKACAKLYRCGYHVSVKGTPVNEDACVSLTVNDVSALSDGQCRDLWNEGDGLSCADFRDWWLV